MEAAEAVGSRGEGAVEDTTTEEEGEGIVVVVVVVRDRGKGVGIAITAGTSTMGAPCAGSEIAQDGSG